LKRDLSGIANRQEWAMKIRTALALVLSGLVFAPLVAKADDDEQGRKACMYDALTMCAKFIPDREQIANCLIAHSERISQSCRLLLVHVPVTNQTSPQK
jgi:hypothetical protein